ncbi:hypothetical protein [Lentzea sp. NPDC003310]|uniref:hypothetical protein n=1 Tax=Lentzea sp. NPDC003310 TaxID=3154447 RepID=UPI0033BF0689
MRDALDDDLAELYAVRGADDVRLARLREQLFAEAPVRRSRRWVGAAAAALAVVMITGLVVLLRPESRDAPATLPVKPAESLAEAATLLETAEKPAAKYRHVKYTIWQTIVHDHDDRADRGSVVEFEIDAWVPTAGGELINIFRRATGQRQPLAGYPPLEPEVEFADSEMPKLWSTWCAVTPCTESSLSLPLPVDPARKLEGASARVLSPYTTNEQKAATYRELADSPGVHWDNGTVTDAGGVFSFRIDPTTGQVVEFVQQQANRNSLGGVPQLSVSVSWEWSDQRPS